MALFCWPIRLDIVYPILVLLCAGATFFAATRIEPTPSQCDLISYSWSPATDVVEYHWETFENYQFSLETDYFGLDASSQIESAWSELLPVSPISVPASRVKDLGFPESENDEDWVRDPGNENAILALPEYAVQLGCLNFLRQVSYRERRDFSHLASFQGGESLVWERAYQCIERLRQAFMCWGDVTPILLHYLGEPSNHSDNVGYDFGTLHYCRNFEDINKWTKDNAVEEVLMDNMWWGGNSEL